MEHATSFFPVHPSDERQSRRGRFIERLFKGKERKATVEETGADVEQFLQSSSQSLAASPTSIPHALQSSELVRSATLTSVANGSNAPQQVANNPPRLIRTDTTGLPRPLNRSLTIDTRIVNHGSKFSSLADSQGDSNSGSYAPVHAFRPNRKKMMVHFTDTYPEIIGQGGDECESRTIDISIRKNTEKRNPSVDSRITSPAVAYFNAPSSALVSALPSAAFSPPHPAFTSGQGSLVRPGQPIGSSKHIIPRKPAPPVPASSQALIVTTDEEVCPESPDTRISLPCASTGLAAKSAFDDDNSTVLPGHTASPRFLGAMRGQDEHRRSFIETHSAQMLEAEGQAFARAARSASATSISGFNWDEAGTIPVPESAFPDFGLRHQSPDSVARGLPVGDHSPESVISEACPNRQAVDIPHSRSHGASLGLQTKPPLPSLTQPPSLLLQLAPAGSNEAVPEPASPPSPPPPHSASLGQSERRQHHSQERQQPQLQNKQAPDIAQFNEALGTLVARTRHFFETFRLHSEALRPLKTYDPIQLSRASLWWFLRGRNALEVAVRERPSSPQSQMRHDLTHQQAYANLAKSYWICEYAIPFVATANCQPLDPDLDMVNQALLSSLRKLALSMKRNGSLPPEDILLSPAVDRSIWVEYPVISPDLVAQLHGRNGLGSTPLSTCSHGTPSTHSGLASSPHPRLPSAATDLLEIFPLGDTMSSFCFGRVYADVFLTETSHQTAATTNSPYPPDPKVTTSDAQQRLSFPCIISIVRPHKQLNHVFVLTSQNGGVQLRLQEGKSSLGSPSLDEARWRNDEFTLEIKLKHGSVLQARCLPSDYRILWSMYDFGRQWRASLCARPDEVAVFRSTAAVFQYFDADPHSRQFPREAVPHCDVALFERTSRQIQDGIMRTHHRGFRVAVTTSARTRTLSGVVHIYPPSYPVQFSFLRGEAGAPALLVRYEAGSQTGSMVFSFSDEAERTRFHSLLTGTAMHHDEHVFVDVALPAFSVAPLRGGMPVPDAVHALGRLPWRTARIVNEDLGGGADSPLPVVCSDRLRILTDFKNGTLADRVNAGPGELRLRLEPGETRLRILRVLRRPQADLTAALSEAQMPRDTARTFADALHALAAQSTVRTYTFDSLRDLHDFQTALTSFAVRFDGLPCLFSMSRRRAVVASIHTKKWETTSARVQVVTGGAMNSPGGASGNSGDDGVVLMLVFFDEDFAHIARALALNLRASNGYELIKRAGKPGLRLFDTKLTLPGANADGADVAGPGARAGAEFLQDGGDVSKALPLLGESDFVSLDLLESPSELGEVAIMFEAEDERDRLVAVLPAQVKNPARLPKIR